MAPPKGHPKYGGRAKGTPNKTTADVKEALTAALNSGEGAQAYFEEVKRSRPDIFCTLVGKLLPKDVNVGVSGEIVARVVRAFVKDPAGGA